MGFHHLALIRLRTTNKFMQPIEYQKMSINCTSLTSTPINVGTDLHGFPSFGSVHSPHEYWTPIVIKYSELTELLPVDIELRHPLHGKLARSQDRVRRAKDQDWEHNQQIVRQAAPENVSEIISLLEHGSPIAYSIQKSKEVLWESESFNGPQWFSRNIWHKWHLTAHTRMNESKWGRDSPWRTAKANWTKQVMAATVLLAVESRCIGKNWIGKK